MKFCHLMPDDFATIDSTAPISWKQDDGSRHLENRELATTPKRTERHHESLSVVAWQPLPYKTVVKQAPCPEIKEGGSRRLENRKSQAIWTVIYQSAWNFVFRCLMTAIMQNKRQK
jgi:hypothetical protein